MPNVGSTGLKLGRVPDLVVSSGSCATTNEMVGRSLHTAHEHNASPMYSTTGFTPG